MRLASPRSHCLANTLHQVLHLHLDGPESAVTGTDIKSAAKATKGHSAADLQIVAREALMLPVSFRERVTLCLHAR